MAGDTTPHVPFADDGGEFRSVGDALCAEHIINWRWKNPGSPNENALCGRMNKIIRMKQGKMMVPTNSNDWLAHLQTVAENTNNQIAVDTDRTPYKLWQPGTISLQRI